MAKPTQSKGIFYKGYNKGKASGPSPSERSPQDIPAPSASPQSVKDRMVYQADNALNAITIRLPFGSKKK